MKAVFIADVEMKETDGIYKKIYAEAFALGNIIGDCMLILRNETGSLLINTHTGQMEKTGGSVLERATNILENDKIDILYIRRMNPSIKLYKLLSKAMPKKTKVYYEIPTYPFYAEQFRTSKKKHRAIAKIVIDVLFSPFIYKKCDRIVVIRSNSRMNLNGKMIAITNGVQSDSIKAKNYNKPWDGVFRMVAVGTLYPYHGYDRILQGMYLCQEEVEGIPVEFHIIGESQTIEDLQALAHQLCLKRVFFHGVKTTDELNDMFDRFDAGVGCVALHRRNADIDTTIKLIEYYCRGVPGITSGISPYKDPSMTITVPDDENPISIHTIYDAWKKMPADKLSELSNHAKAQFSWETIMKGILTEKAERDQ